MSILFIFVGVIAGGTAALLFYAQKSPIGYQNEAGFYFGVDDGFTTPPAYEPTSQVPPTSSEAKEQFADKMFRPFFPLPIPWMVKGFALAILLFSLVLFPKISWNHASEMASVASYETDETLSIEDLTSFEFDFLIETEAVLAGAAQVDHARFSQKLCTKFSQVE